MTESPFLILINALTPQPAPGRPALRNRKSRSQMHFAYVFSLVCLVVSVQAAISGAKSKDKVVSIIRDGDKHMKTRTLASVTKAAELYRSALTENPDDPELQLKTADAINAIMRIKSNANTILIEGSLDNAENKALWATLGKEVRPQLAIPHYFDV